MNGFGPLAREAIADALRRRIAAAVALAALVSVLMLESCTSCSPSVNVNGQLREMSELAGPAGLGAFVVLGLWVIALAGVLAADHLQSTLEDGSALLALARPIARDSFALARLAGVLGLAFCAGLVMLGSAAALLATRSGLPVAPALAAGAACTLGCIAVAALAMTASLLLPRAATLLLVLGGVWLSAFANASAPSPRSAGGSARSTGSGRRSHRPWPSRSPPGSRASRSRATPCASTRALRPGRSPACSRWSTRSGAWSCAARLCERGAGTFVK